jgi:hypothetical protein
MIGRREEGEKGRKGEGENWILYRFLILLV